MGGPPNRAVNTTWLRTGEDLKGAKINYFLLLGPRLLVAALPGVSGGRLEIRRYFARRNFPRSRNFYINFL